MTGRRPGLQSGLLRRWPGFAILATPRLRASLRHRAERSLEEETRLYHFFAVLGSLGLVVVLLRLKWKAGRALALSAAALALVLPARPAALGSSSAATGARTPGRRPSRSRPPTW